MEQEKQTVETAQSKSKPGSKPKPKPNPMHKVEIKNQKEITVTGVTRVNASSPTSSSMQIGSTTLTITGEEMHVKRLDVSEGIVEIAGKIIAVKYSGGKKSQDNIFKRIFK